MSGYTQPTPVEGFLDPDDPILFPRLTAAQIEHLAEGSETLSFSAGEVVFEHGRPVGRSGRGAVTRFAIATVGRVMWELIEPLDEESVWARFLAEKGGGVHHIAVATPDFDGAVAEQAKRGDDPVLGGIFGGVKLAYLPTDGDLGVIVEIFGEMPSDGEGPDST